MSIAVTGDKELVDVYDDAGLWRGTADRNHVHRDGSWHRCFHCLIVTDHGRVPTLLLQRRGLKLAEFPGLIDVSVAGHVRAGERLTDAVRREFGEELGVETSPDELEWIGDYPLVIRAGRVFARELTDIFVRRDDRPPATVPFNPIEVASLVGVDLAAVCELWTGARRRVEVTEWTPGGRFRRSALIADFVNDVPAYWSWLARQLRRAFSSGASP